MRIQGPGGPGPSAPAHRGPKTCEHFFSPERRSGSLGCECCRGTDFSAATTGTRAIHLTPGSDVEELREVLGTTCNDRAEARWMVRSTRARVGGTFGHWTRVKYMFQAKPLLQIDAQWRSSYRKKYREVNDKNIELDTSVKPSTQVTAGGTRRALSLATRQAASNMQVAIQPAV